MSKTRVIMPECAIENEEVTIELPLETIWNVVNAFASGAKEYTVPKAYDPISGMFVSVEFRNKKVNACVECGEDYDDGTKAFCGGSFCKAAEGDDEDDAQFDFDDTSLEP